MSADIENCSKLANLKQEGRTEQVLREKRWEAEKAALVRQLDEKDRQIAAYRVEIERILGELKTDRNEM